MKPKMTLEDHYKIYMAIFVCDSPEEKISELADAVPEAEFCILLTTAGISINDRNSNRFDTQGSFIDRLKLYLNDSEFAEKENE